jgi:hypothetical protein
MKRYVRGTLVALAAPAVAGAMFMAPSATAAVATTAVPAAALQCHTSMSNSRPKDHTTTYVNVSTVRYAGVITVAHYKTVNTKHTGKANAKGNAKIGYAVGSAKPGYRVKVSVTVTSGRSHGSCSTSFTPQK